MRRAAQQQGESQGLSRRPHALRRGRGLRRQLTARQAALRHLPHAGHGGRRHPTIRDNQQWIAHYHTAGVPGRHELDGTQELQYPAIAKAIVDIGFTGFMAQEFVPVRDPSRRCGGRGALRRVRSRNRPRLAGSSDYRPRLGFVETLGAPCDRTHILGNDQREGQRAAREVEGALARGQRPPRGDQAGGKTVAEFPITVGVVGAVFAPTLAAVGAVVAVLTDCTWKSSEPNLSRSEARTPTATAHLELRVVVLQYFSGNYFRCFPPAWSSRTC